MESSEFEAMTGACMCGTVKFEVDAPLVGSALCWCKRCQRRTGTAFSATGLTQVGSFHVTAGNDVLKTYEPGDGGFNKTFCSNCGGQVSTSSPDNPDIIAIRLGALDDDPGIRPLAHQFVSSASDWFPVPDDGLPRFPERLDWSTVLADT